MRADKLSEQTEIRMSEGSVDLDGYHFLEIGHSTLALLWRESIGDQWIALLKGQ